MTTTTEMGPNSAYITCALADTTTTIMTAISSWLQLHGWAVHDNVSSTAIVFKAPIAGLATFKYVHVNLTTTALTLNLYESWNEVTHVGTNAAYAQNNSVVLSVGVTDGFSIFLYATARYITVASKIATVYSFSTGVYEMTRDNSEDLGTVPPVFMFSTNLSITSSYTAPVICIPRTKAGMVGLTAAQSAGLLWSFGFLKVAKYSNPSTLDMIYGEIFWPGGNNTWSGTPLAASPSIFLDAAGAVATDWNAFGQDIGRTIVDFHGRAYGMKMIPTGLGSPQDILPIKCDANGFADANGTVVDHHILAYGTYRIAVPM